jgi:hypothetical protein
VKLVESDAQFQNAYGGARVVTCKYYLNSQNVASVSVD